jgi:GTP cyclohydrolase III
VDWPGQLYAYTEFVEVLALEDHGAQQHPDKAQDYRPDYHTIIGLTNDEVGVIWSTVLAADTRRKELEAEFYAQYPRTPPAEVRENPDEAAKHRQAAADLNRNEDLAIENAIDELKVQIGHDDFLRLDSWVRDHFAPKHPPQHHTPQRR